MKKVFAFTLAEVLITLGIIGIVAAMTIPTVIQKHREKVTITKLKKANSVLAQIYMTAQADNGVYAFSDIPRQSETDEFFNAYWKPYLKISKICASAADCGYSSDKPFKYANGTQFDYNIVLEGRKTFITNDGVLYFVVVYTLPSSGKVYRHEIYVDVNASDPPNTFGKDVFAFKYIDGRTVFPFGYQLSNEELGCTISNPSTGRACAERIRRNGWQVPVDYPFKL